MNKDNKLLKLLIKIGVTILGILSFFLLKNRFISENKEKVDKDIRDIKEINKRDIDNTNVNIKTLNTIKETIQENQKTQEEIVNTIAHMNKKRAENVGFKKENERQ
jgi:low affinity Fe/Cu permease